MLSWIGLPREQAGVEIGGRSSNMSLGIAQAPDALPLIGHALPLLRAPLKFLTSLPDHGDLVQIRIGPYRSVVVCDPELTRRVLRDDRTFDKGGPFLDRMRNVLGNGLVTCPSDEHRRQRRRVQPVFHHTRLPRYVRCMTEEATAVCGSWRDCQVLDVVAEMQEITSRVLLTTLFSSSLPAHSRSATIADLAIVADGTYPRIFRPRWMDRLRTPGDRRYFGAITRLRETVGRIIDERRASEVPETHDDLLSHLLATSSKGHDGRSLSDAEMTDQTISFFLPGIETTAVTLAWALHLLASHPDIELRVHREVDDVVRQRPIGHDSLAELPLTRHVITETLRLYPPAWILTRITRTDTELGGHLIPARTTIAYSPYLIHRRPDLYRHADQFEPDRWMDPSASPPERFLAFGGGPRKCIGDAFGFTEAVLVLATIVASWRLETLSEMPVRPVIGASLRPRELRLRAAKRTYRHPVHHDGERGGALDGAARSN